MLNEKIIMRMIIIIISKLSVQKQTLLSVAIAGIPAIHVIGTNTAETMSSIGTGQCGAFPGTDYSRYIEVETDP